MTCNDVVYKQVSARSYRPIEKFYKGDCNPAGAWTKNQIELNLKLSSLNVGFLRITVSAIF